MSEVTVCVQDTSEWPLHRECVVCKHPGLLHPGRGGMIEGCLACMHQKLYGEFYTESGHTVDDTIRRTLLRGDSRDDLLDVISMMVDQYCFTDSDVVWDSRALTSAAAAMRILALNGRFKIKHQYGRRVVGELLREPPWIV
jgi:hypothetical protein